MTHVALVLPEAGEEAGLLRVMERFARRGPLQVRLCLQEARLPDSRRRLLAQLEGLGAATSSHLSITAEDLLALGPDLVIVACKAADAGGPGISQDLVRDLSRRAPQPVWITNGHTGPPLSVTALIDPDRQSGFDPRLSAEVLRLSFTLSRALNVPLDIINVWYFLEEGLLRSRRIRMPEPEITERKRRAAWIAQSALARLLSTLPPDLTWRRLDHVQGPVRDMLGRDLPDTSLVVAGSDGRDGWAARLQPNLAEDLCHHGKTGVVIAKHPAPASSDHPGRGTCPEADTDAMHPGDPHQRKRLGS